MVPWPGVLGMSDALSILDVLVTDNRVNMPVAEVILALVGLSSDVLTD